MIASCPLFTFIMVHNKKVNKEERPKAHNHDHNSNELGGLDEDCDHKLRKSYKKRNYRYLTKKDLSMR